MITSTMMWKGSDGVGYATWKECAIAEATKQLRAWLPDIENRDAIALEMARLVYVDKDEEACAAWGKLYRIAETEPDYAADGSEIFPRQYEPMTDVPKMFKADQKQRGFFRTIVGGRS